MRAVLPSFVEKILFSFLSGNNRSQMVRLPREIVIFTGNDSDLNECTGLGLNKFGAGPGFRYLCRKGSYYMGTSGSVPGWYDKPTLVIWLDNRRL